MAVPTVMLDEVSPLCDFEFILAQHSNDVKYVEYYKASKRRKLMDNGFHEMGRPLSSPELVDACKIFEPDFVVAPDWLGDPNATFKAFEEMKRILPPDLKTRLAVVLCGRDPGERAQFFENVRRSCSMLCFPFKEDRLTWFNELMQRTPKYIPWPPYIHLLGCSSLEEFVAWRNLAFQHGLNYERISADTCKPIKFGMAKEHITADTTLRGKSGWPTDPIKAKPTQEQLQAIYYNVAFMRRFL